MKDQTEFPNRPASGPAVSTFWALALLLAAGGIAMTLAAKAQATMVPAYGLDALVAQAESIVLGRVDSVKSVWSEDQTTIYTDIHFQVADLIYGDVEGEALTLRLEGGAIDEYELVIDGSPVFREGDTELLFVSGNGEAVSPVVGFFQGRFRIIDGQVHDFAGLPIVKISDGQFVKLVDDLGGDDGAGIVLGEVESVIHSYELAADYNEVEAQWIAATQAAVDNSGEVEASDTGKSGSDAPDTDASEALPPPKELTPGVLPPPSASAGSIYIYPDQDTGDRLTTEQFIDAIHALIDAH